MRRALTLLLTLSIALGLAACVFQSRQDTVLHSLGKYEQKQFLTCGEFQDYTDFGIYTCEPKSIKESDNFSKVSQEDIEVICDFLDDYESFIQYVREYDPGDALGKNYYFNRPLLDMEDYFYIWTSDSAHPDWNYDLWVFDTQTNVLYYFHTNI